MLTSVPELLEYFDSKQASGNQEQLHVRENGLPHYRSTQRVGILQLVHTLEHIGYDKIPYISEKYDNSVGKVSILLPVSWINDIIIELNNLINLPVATTEE